MTWPDFNEKGNLPPGIYTAGMSDLLAKFGHGSAKREAAARSLQQVVQLAARTGHLNQIVVFGSFVTVKPMPNDIDVILVMDDGFQLEKCDAQVAVLFDHGRAQRELGASVFWIRPALLINDSLSQFIARWQLTRDGDLRGIVKVNCD